ncbi:MAG: AMP-binding protein [Candidatus Latescibacteria bacterium]|nr:AMP-binding protein [bacterium]MBD3423733.1 AMP-binding protein [Candidatus Latescibacterota bacterium]
MTDYDKTREEFSLEVPEYFNFGFDVVDKWAVDRTKLAFAIADEDGEIIKKRTFYELKRESNRFANVLRDQGIGKGDRVLVMLHWMPQWYIAMIAMIKLGVVPIPSTTLLTSKDIRYRVNEAEAVGVITDSPDASKVEAELENCPSLKTLILATGTRRGWLKWDKVINDASPVLDGIDRTRSDDTMLLYFTSGTVSQPKMVLHTQASYAIAHRITAQFWQDLKPTDLHWTVTDTGWAKAAWGSLFGQWTMGAAVFNQYSRDKFDAKLTLRLIEDQGITTFCAPPTAYRMFAQLPLEDYDLSSIRHCMSAGEPLNPEIINVWEKATGTKIYDGYGQTETVNLCANFRCKPIKIGSMGLPTPGFDVRIVDENQEETGPGEEGYIVVKVKPERPVGLFKEYWKDPEKTRSVFEGDYYYTGDKAYRDEDGYFWFVGRADDVILSAGYRIGPFEVESALVEHPAVTESAVVASPDEVRGEIVKAFVILAEDYEPGDKLVKELQDHVKEVTAPYKYPRAIEFVKALPKTVSGKIRRGELKKQEWKKK